MNTTLRGSIFNIQRYSIHDGPGIRTTVFFKGCPLRCFWCQNPESQEEQPEIFLNKSSCTLCGRCIAVCSTGASSLSETSSIVDRHLCIGCGKCAEVCPNGARRLVGNYLTVDEVMQEVVRDRKFYENSGGGVTLSGGDPTSQPEFSLALLRACKETGLHTALDTCGYAVWSTMEKLLEYTDLVLFDIKHLDPMKHRRATGKSNRMILQNARRMARHRAMRVRIPIIKGFNKSSKDIRTIARFVKEQVGSVEIDLLPYNKFGEGKYELLDRPSFYGESDGEEEIRALEAEVNMELGKGDSI